MKTVTINSKSHTEMKDITREISKLIPSDFKSGICHLFCMHTTAGLTINENADPDVVNDMIRYFDENIPWNDKKYRHMEGNTAAHIKSTLFGPSLTVPIENGRLILGTWQSVYFCEFDGPRSMRKVDVRFIADIDN
ncbi:MAG: YjbQ family protein [bacterium]|nr:YjbQ family protein [bacterium]